MSEKLVRAVSDKDFKYLLPIGDIHLGHPAADISKVRGYLQWALDNDAWILMMGDESENSTRASVGAGVYEQTLQPKEQWKEIRELFRPVIEAGLVLGKLTGNHEERTFKLAGKDPSEDFCREMRIPYLRYGGFLDLKVQGQRYAVYAQHGATSSATPGGRINAILKMAQIAHADIYCMGHVHALDHTRRDVLTLDRRHGKVRRMRQTFVLTGHFVTYEDTYSEMKSYAPNTLGAARIRLDGTKHDVHVSV